jgi:hypothetical protein
LRWSSRTNPPIKQGDLLGCIAQYIYGYDDDDCRFLHAPPSTPRNTTFHAHAQVLGHWAWRTTTSYKRLPGYNTIIMDQEENAPLRAAAASKWTGDDSPKPSRKFQSPSRICAPSVPRERPVMCALSPARQPRRRNGSTDPYILSRHLRSTHHEPLISRARSPFIALHLRRAGPCIDAGSPRTVTGINFI